MSEAPIGVFDSGLGGLTVAAQILKKLPNESVIYLADTAHVPYGERPLTEIRGFALDITGFLHSLGAKMVVMACNMSSAVALEAAKERYRDIALLGVIEAGARAAARCSQNKAIGVLATTGTVNSGAYSMAIHRIKPGAAAIERACPAFVPLVEAGKQDSPEAYAAARDYTRDLPHSNVGAIILGCTHYPFLTEAIMAAVGPQVPLIDPAEETVAEVENVLVERRINAPPDRAAEHRFFVTGEPANFAELGGRFIGRTIACVERVVWGVDIGKVYA